MKTSIIYLLFMFSEIVGKEGIATSYVLSFHSFPQRVELSSAYI